MRALAGSRPPERDCALELHEVAIAVDEQRGADALSLPLRLVERQHNRDPLAVALAIEPAAVVLLASHRDEAAAPVPPSPPVASDAAVVASTDPAAPN